VIEVPECRLFDGGCFATPEVHGDQSCYSFHNVHFVELHIATGNGGAFRMDGCGSFELIECTFLRCSPTAGTWGGAFYCRNLSGTFTMADCCANECVGELGSFFSVISDVYYGHIVNSLTA
jgi:hypothetical protein